MLQFFNLTTTIFWLWFFLGIVPINAQICTVKRGFKASPEEDAFNSYVLDYRTQNLHLNNDIKYIPLVFHIIKKSESDDIPYNRILDQIAVTNKDLRRLNADSIFTRPEFIDVAADCHIELCLSTKNNQGANFNGIIIYNLPNFDIYNDLNLLIQNNIYPPNQYLNVWITPGEGASASFPWLNNTPYADYGIIIGNMSFGITGNLNPITNRGRTFTHEVGHYLGLYHTFEGTHNVGDCNFPHGDFTGDRCADTPLDWSFFPIPSAYCDNGLRTCDNNQTYLSQTENYMFYNNDSCLNMFSKDQRVRMRACLHHLRSELVSSQNHILTGIDCSLTHSQSNIYSPKINVYPNPFSNYIFIDFRTTDIIDTKISIYATDGRLIFEVINASNLHYINTSSLSNGIYILVLENAMAYQSIKLIK